MADEFKYFVIPYEAVSADPPYTVWYASWSQTRPELEEGMSAPMVIGYTTDSVLPPGAVLVGAAPTTKTPPIPPPPPPPAVGNLPAYQQTFEDWIARRRVF